MSGAATPYAPASARASLPPTGSATPALPPPPPAAAPRRLPPPSTFDVLPDLHKLLKRLLETPSQPPGATPSPAQAQAQASNDGPLDAQHVATAANDLRLKIQKARRAVLSLPDMDRTCEDQEDEIRDLEARIASLKASLSGLGQSTPQAEPGDRDEDQRMTG
ncbi:hypothetical protein IAQ61_010199 [Plenodomus lingam]|uniref:Mediator of RNA polymerase II transcription subunit 9 n=1 Tax=Leptosphaeria maculans (strain JN3 / isolate v23.1.3 / race Av1-4-5-6-7-8) TaxID=985895 RepID=E5A381_LEPMJ|nr:predicted protein [Plenodomus lingam JN3]KAH9861998.1 hypothetical protein IAQ61_010199 [Plenodomus lingam]CBX98094.1 predicted protein [Plenodomus lingam JN3]